MKKIITLIITLLSLSANAGEITGTNVFAYSPYTVGALGDIIHAPLTQVIGGDYVNGMLSQIVTSGTPLNSATATVSSGRLLLQTGTNAAGAVAVVSKKPISYIQGEGSILRYTAAYTTCVANSVQWIGVANYTASASNTAYLDGVLTGCNGATFGINYRNNGSDTFIAQAAWNIDKMNGVGKSGITLNYALGNIYQVKYPYLGYGDIEIAVQNPDTGIIIPVHRIKYANSSINTEFANPNMSFYAMALNSGNTTNLSMYNGSFGGFVTGDRKFNGAIFGAANRKSAITTRTNIFTIKVASSVNGNAFRRPIKLKSCSFACDGANDTCQFDIVKDTTLGGTPSYAPINGSTADGGTTLTNANSVASIDTAGTTVTGGTIQFNASAARNTGFEMNMVDYDLFLVNGETMTMAITGDTSVTARVSCNWVE